MNFMNVLNNQNVVAICYKYDYLIMIGPALFPVDLASHSVIIRPVDTVPAVCSRIQALLVTYTV